MKAFLVIACILMAGFLLTGCSAGSRQFPASSSAPESAVVLPVSDESGSQTSAQEATLWFRFSTEPYLAPESRAITQRKGQSYEMALLEALFAGPGTQHHELVGALPEGSRVISAVLQGRVLLVTVSGEFLGMPADIPMDWQEYDFWRTEAPLRRKLAMQSIAATVSENCDVDAVQILVDENIADGASLRLKQNWFLDDSEESRLTGPQYRDESLLLTPAGTGKAILRHWLERDWENLYLYVSQRDPQSGMTRPEYRNFAASMNGLPSLISAELMDCSVSEDGQRTTVSVHARIRPDQGQREISRNAVLHLARENGIWKLSFSQLTEWLEE